MKLPRCGAWTSELGGPSERASASAVGVDARRPMAPAMRYRRTTEASGTGFHFPDFGAFGCTVQAQFGCGKREAHGTAFVHELPVPLNK